jgi:uncharacterized protein GlcG (DUF336 family)
VVAVYDSTGHLALLHRMDDAFVAQVGAAALQAGPAGVGLEPD